jgi:effector-binding domain-containing protein
MNATCRIVTTERQLTAVVKIKAEMDKLREAHERSRAKLAAVLPSLDTGPLGATCTRWRSPANGSMEMEPGIIVAKRFAAKGEVVSSELPAGRAAHVVLTGSFEGLGGAWKTLFDWCAAEKLALAGTNWEVYGATPDDPAKQQTFLYALLA